MPEPDGGFSFKVTTLGCRVNRADSLAIERSIRRSGGSCAAVGEQPEFWVLNTCAVTAEAMRKSRKAARRCAVSGARVMVTGCASELEPDTFERIAGPGSVVSNSGKDDLIEKPACEPTASGCGNTLSCGEAVRVPVKVQDGCNRYCAYCIVPFLRGNERSRYIDSVTADIEELRESGAGEIVVCGIDLGSYRDPTDGAGLVELLGRVLGVSGKMWIRLSSLELSDVSDRLLELMDESPSLCSHLHLPLQSGDDGVLGDMGREYRGDEFVERVTDIRGRVPGVAITTDVMVGFPTETEEAFVNTRTVLSELGCSRVHVFKYSPRPGTAACALGDPVEAAVKESRAALLRAQGAGMAERFYATLNGRIMPVLVEATMKSMPGCVFGRAQNFAGLVMPGGSGMVGRFVPVRVTGSNAGWLTGEALSTPGSCPESEGY